MSEPAICRRLQLSAAGLAIIADLGSRSMRLLGTSGSRSVIQAHDSQVSTSLACYFEQILR
jgi:hypothetical protein